MFQEVDKALPRANYRSVKALHAGFNGAISAKLYPTDAKRLKFQAQVTFETGDGATPTVEFVPCTDSGKVRTFGDVDDLMRWSNSAFADITSFTSQVIGYDDVNKPFVAPTDVFTDAERKVERFTNYKENIDEKLVDAEAKVQAEVVAGYADANAHVALVAIHTETKKKRDTIQEISDYYQSQIDHNNAVLATRP